MQRMDGIEERDGKKAERVRTRDLPWLKRISAAPPPTRVTSQSWRIFPEVENANHAD